MKIKSQFIIALLLLCSLNTFAQDKLYPNTFPLGDVTLLDGPFKHASELIIQTLLKYDVDRLLAPYRKEAGLTAKATSYANWSGWMVTLVVIICRRWPSMKKADLSLMVRYWGNEGGSRSFNIFVDGTLIKTENVVGKWNKNEFVNIEYPIPNSLTVGKDTITVKFQAINTSNVVGGLFYVRLLQPLSTTDIVAPQSEKQAWIAVGLKNKIQIAGLTDKSIVCVYDSCGKILFKQKTTLPNLTVPCSGQGLRLVQITSENKLHTVRVLMQ